MNKAAIQRFAIWARTELITQVSQRAYQYGITKDGCGDAGAVAVSGRALTMDEQRQRRELVGQIRSKGYTQVMEEVAYTWFNRFIALRFMEVNNYLPSHIRVFSDSTGVFKPEILNDVLHLDLPGLNTDRTAAYIEANQTENLYRYLLLTQCNALNESMPSMFEQMGSFTELLLPNNILKPDSILGRMVTDIPEEDWMDQVQIIGWLYQYYNSELKDETFALLKKNVKITKERIPSATQLFTPDWIVRYMVENSLGRLWLEGHPDDELKAGWKYYLDEAEQAPDVQAQLEAIRAEYRNIKPQDIKVIDPCMGSGHILVYAFDVLVQIYKKYGFSERDAAQSILENNLYGLDIDDRAAQLAYFAVMMKARQYDRRIFTRGIQPHVYTIVESNGLDGNAIEYFTNNDPKLVKDFGTLVEELWDAKEYGSILNISQVDFAALYARIDEVRGDISIFKDAVLNSILPLIKVAEVMAQKYDVVVTNPPYMGGGSMEENLSQYVRKYFPKTKSDLSTVFMEKALKMSKNNGLVAMINIPVWMFISSYRDLREQLLHYSTISNMLHFGRGVFGSDFGSTAFVYLKRRIKDYISVFQKLYLVHGAVDTVEQKKKWFFERIGLNYVSQDQFNFIPGFPFAYWVSPDFIKSFSSGKLIGQLGQVSEGIKTGDNEKFLRFWHEVNASKFSFAQNSENFKWIPYHKGGDFRKWYGNNTYAINWGNDGEEIKNQGNSGLQGKSMYFSSVIGYSKISARGNPMRYFDEGVLFDSMAPSIRLNNHQAYCLGFLNSTVGVYYIRVLNPTMATQVGDIKNIPLIVRSECLVDDKVKKCINLSQCDWNAVETSWDFQCHPLVRCKTVADAYAAWKGECNDRFNILKANEEELNRIFIDIYGLQDELTPEVEDKDVTVRKANLGRDIRSLISYAIGCMFGRYSLDVDGLAYAGGEWDSSKYTTFLPDKDNIIPLCDDDYFDDDITGRFINWVSTVYGKETLEENLRFIADALGGKGASREVIRSYFLNGFYADHLKIYQKRPIYWLFDSGKKNGFKALIYMHRYQGDLLARMRTDYVHEQQERYRTQLAHIADTLENASGSERVKLAKQQKKIQEQALEIQKYEEKVHHLADQNIQIDLDDGVKHNYALFADVLAKLK